MNCKQDTIFAKIIRKEIPADIVFESDTVIAFRDIAPQAPVHILVLPKKPLRGVADAEHQDRELLGELLLTAAELARKEHLDNGYRLVINNGENAGQAVPHLHVHLLGGRAMGWPPG